MRVATVLFLTVQDSRTSRLDIIELAAHAGKAHMHTLALWATSQIESSSQSRAVEVGIEYSKIGRTKVDYCIGFGLPLSLEVDSPWFNGIVISVVV